MKNHKKAGLVALATASLVLASPASAQFGALGNMLKNALNAQKNTSEPAKQQAPKPVLLGEWMNVGQSCVVASPDADYVEGANLRIETASISGFEWGCDLKPAIPAGATSYSGEQICYGDGADDTPTPIALELQPDGTLRMDDGNTSQTLRRCE